ncbi:SDR family oxidoreductase [Actinomycetospora sp. TBRC 11914]|uniref:SDR family oxidoreductase n=1 Tax=Actinomycetospora sp. TBRC 11914 TaxID=2729387 RepID=UPI00289EB476|nr:SDR family oxidoreductase [Actinomycetospora sp. TBRC 11914]
MSTIVTGAGRGIGAAVARLLAARGTPVALLDVDGGAAARTAASLGPGAVGLGVDVTDAAALEQACDEAAAALGPVDALANVAGVLRTGSVAGLTDDDWAACLATNATGVMHACRAVARRWTAAPPPDGGAIVTVASNAAGVPRAGMAAYAASKAAALAVTRCTGLELAALGVRANVVCPGSTDTAMLAGMPAAPSALVAGTPESFKLGIPLGRVADPDDVAGTVAFLLSDAARHVTLQTLYVDGGASLGP